MSAVMPMAESDLSLSVQSGHALAVADFPAPKNCNQANGLASNHALGGVVSGLLLGNGLFEASRAQYTFTLDNTTLRRN
jgi:Na+/glutamate symporter